MNSNNNEKIVAKLILKKISKSLKISICIFIIVLFSVISISMFLISQKLQTNKDFYSNPKMHLIQITSHRDILSNKREMSLTYDDIKNLSHILQQKYSSENQYLQINCYMFNFGIGTNELSRTFFIYGLSEDAGKLLFNLKFDDNVLYLHSDCKNNADTIKLKIPIIDIEYDGFSSKRFQLLDLKVDNNVNVDPINLFSNSDINEMAIVNLNTFKKIMEISYNKSWKELVSDNNVFMPIFLYKVYIYSYDILDISSISQYIEKNNYIISSPLLAFEDSNLSLQKIELLILSIMIIICFFTFFQFVLSFKFYLQIQKKDIGILKQMGYNDRLIFKIYKININKIFYTLMIIVNIYTIISGFLVLNERSIYYILIVLLLFNLLLWFSKIIIKIILKKLIKLPVLELLKKNKDFE